MSALNLFVALAICAVAFATADSHLRKLYTAPEQYIKFTKYVYGTQTCSGGQYWTRILPLNTCSWLGSGVYINWLYTAGSLQLKTYSDSDCSDLTSTALDFEVTAGTCTSNGGNDYLATVLTSVPSTDAGYLPYYAGQTQCQEETNILQYDYIPLDTCVNGYTYSSCSNVGEMGTACTTPTSAPVTFAPTVSFSPSATPTLAPSASPTVSLSPSFAPTLAPSATPTVSLSPSFAPSQPPSFSPTTAKPTFLPSQAPSFAPSTVAPTFVPSTASPTFAPSTAAPSFSFSPSQTPSLAPSFSPSTVAPTFAPSTAKPTLTPSLAPSFSPSTVAPTFAPSTAKPTLTPSLAPSFSPSTAAPTFAPSTAKPTLTPSFAPTFAPSTASPTFAPSSAAPSVSLPPSFAPSTAKPTTAEPTATPTTAKPTATPTAGPTQACRRVYSKSADDDAGLTLFGFISSDIIIVDDAWVPFGNYTCSESSDDDDEVCFSGRETVLMESGSYKYISEVAVGDRVLAFDGQETVFSDVVHVPHAANKREAQFVAIATVSGKDIQMTPDHLLFAGDCSNSGSLLKASQVAVGMCINTVDGQEKISSVEMQKGEGIYSIVLEKEYLVVNGIVASPFAHNHFIANTFYNLHRAVYKMLGTSASQWMQRTTEYAGMFTEGFLTIFS